VLCRFGQARDQKLQQTLVHLLETQHDDGGWRCNKFSYGRGPETGFSNPGVTLAVLDAFRFTDHVNTNPALDRAVDSLLDHWVVRRPMGPCHFGIGTLFMQVEFPFLRYNLFYYVYVLSFYDRARDDPRYLEALRLLESSSTRAAESSSSARTAGSPSYRSARRGAHPIWRRPVTARS
jgi:hypothetical protein